MQKQNLSSTTHDSFLLRQEKTQITVPQMNILAFLRQRLSHQANLT